jgi:hypothetical protein
MFMSARIVAHYSILIMMLLKDVRDAKHHLYVTDALRVQRKLFICVKIAIAS